MRWSSSKSRRSLARCKAGADATQAISPARPAGLIHLEQAADTMRHKKAVPNRSFRVADQIQRDVAELIRDLKDPRVGMVTINSVDVTPDYAHAQIYFSVLLGDPAESAKALNEAGGFLRNGLFKRLAIHTVPTLHFHFDKTTERAADLSALITKANSVRAKED